MTYDELILLTEAEISNKIQTIRKASISAQTGEMLSRRVTIFLEELKTKKQSKYMSGMEAEIDGFDIYKFSELCVDVDVREISGLPDKLKTAIKDIERLKWAEENLNKKIKEDPEFFTKGHVADTVMLVKEKLVNTNQKPNQNLTQVQQIQADRIARETIIANAFRHNALKIADPIFHNDIQYMTAYANRIYEICKHAIEQIDLNNVNNGSRVSHPLI